MSRYHKNLKYLLDNQANAAKYKQWVDMNKSQRQAAYKTAATQGGARTPVVREKGFLIPMRASASSKVVGSYPIIPTNAGSTISTSLRSILNPHYQKIVAPPGFQVSEAKGRKRPAIVRITQRETNQTPRTSRILGTSYSARKSDSASGGAGKKDETQPVSGNAAAFTEELESALSSWRNAGAFRTTKLIPEIQFIL